MTNSKSTKRALVTSAFAIVMCLAMFIGTTFAWFTDTATSGVNKIQSGTLDVALEMKNADGEWVSAEGQTLSWKAVDNRAQDKILWEPGCTYELQDVRVKNNGNLALKYKIQITGIDGDAKLNEVIEWTVNGATLGKEVSLAAGATSDALTLKGHMLETAGNEYQGLSMEGVAITVVATQDTVESDSYDNQYDKNATYPDPDVAQKTANSSEALADAIANAKDATGKDASKVVVNLTADGTYTLPSIKDKQVTIVGNDNTVIDMTNSGIISAQNGGLDLTIQGADVQFSATDSYKGVTHSEKLTYKDCTITGLQFLYANDVEFINCDIKQTADDMYQLWTYGAKNVTFTGCTFTSTNNSKAVLCYTDALNGETLTRTFNNCTFTCTGTAEKSAIMINPSANGKNTYVININNSTATGYGVNTTTNQSIVGVKETATDNITINVDGQTIYTH